MNVYANNFAFAILTYQKNYKKLNDFITHLTSTKNIIAHFEPLVNANKLVFLKTLCEIRGNYLVDVKNEEEYYENINTLVKLIKKHYTNYEWTMVLKNYTSKQYHSYFKHPILDALIKSVNK